MLKAIGDMDAALDASASTRGGRGRALPPGLLELCGNRRLAALAFTVWDQAPRPARHPSLRPRPWRSNADHRALLAAWAGGREARARRAPPAPPARRQDADARSREARALAALMPPQSTHVRAGRRGGGGPRPLGVDKSP